VDCELAPLPRLLCCRGFGRLLERNDRLTLRRFGDRETLDLDCHTARLLVERVVPSSRPHRRWSRSGGGAGCMQLSTLTGRIITTTFSTDVLDGIKCRNEVNERNAEHV